MNMIYASKSGERIVFDDYTDNVKEYDVYWTEICPHCRNKYKSILGNRVDDDNSAWGTCSVKGCYNFADFYVDFNANEVEFI